MYYKLNCVLNAMTLFVPDSGCWIRRLRAVFLCRNSFHFLFILEAQIYVIRVLVVIKKPLYYNEGTMFNNIYVLSLIFLEIYLKCNVVLYAINLYWVINSIDVWINHNIYKVVSYMCFKLTGVRNWKCFLN